MKTMKEMAQEAIDIQNAENLSGIVHSWSRMFPAYLRAQLERLLGEKFSTDKLNRHPICILYSDKIASLTGSAEGLTFFKSYGFCQDVSADKLVGNEYLDW